MGKLATWQLRAEFARRMAETYGREVPAYATLVEVAAQVNGEVVARGGAAAQRLGSIDRVTAERHGAIRVGTPRELREVAALLAAFGMYPVGYYDLREAATSAVPVVSTAFRPVEAAELARNPFRMFTSLLVTDDRRFFSAELQARLDAFLARRALFPPQLLALAGKAAAAGGLGQDDAQLLLRLATSAFALSDEPVDRAWYQELERVSAVAADIGGVTSTHLNHLTPRVLDIDALQRRMTDRGIAMIDTIQGPPRWSGPEVLLRQTSFRALDEQRLFRDPDGTLAPGSLRVRFGEVESRGVALTPAGRDRYDAMLAEVDRHVQATSRPRQEVAAQVWAERLPSTEAGLARAGLAYFRYEVADRAASVPFAPETSVADLLEAGLVKATPIVYEDFLPRSAAGIFQSNLTAEGTVDSAREGSRRDAGWLSDVIGAPVADPYALYAAEQQASIDEVRAVRL